MPYWNVKSFKKWIFLEFWAIDRHAPHWINFTIISFISQQYWYSKFVDKIWNKIISFDMRKNNNKLRHVIGKVKKKVNLRILGVSPWCFKGGIPIMLGPIFKKFKSAKYIYVKKIIIPNMCTCCVTSCTWTITFVISLAWLIIMFITCKMKYNAC